MFLAGGGVILLETLQLDVQCDTKQVFVDIQLIYYRPG